MRNSRPILLLCLVLLTAAGAGAQTGTQTGASILGPDGTPDGFFGLLHAWYDASDGVNGTGTPADGSPVSRWLDRSANGRDLSGPSTSSRQRPVFRAAAAGGLPALDFDGDDRLVAGEDFESLEGGQTLFFVTKLRAADGGTILAGSDGGFHVDTGVIQTISGTIAWIVGAVLGPPPDLDVFQVHSAISAPGLSRHFVNGALLSEAPAASPALAGLVLGSDATGRLALNGAIAEVLVYDAALGDADRRAVEGYLLGRYPATDPPTPVPFVDVYTREDGLYDSYRIPSLVTTRSGTLLAFAEGRGNAFFDQAENDIVLRRSTDRGDTWSPVMVLHDDGANSLNDPLAVEVRSGDHQGRVLILYNRFPAGCDPSCVVPGYEDEKAGRNFEQHSDDGGLSWSAPREITPQVKRASAAFAGAPGVGIQKRYEPHAGRIAMPFREGRPTRIYAVFSDDGGDSWSYGDRVDASQTPGHGDEVQLVELVDGSLLLNARSAEGTKHRKIARSFDAGQSWTPLRDEYQLIEPQVMASIYRLTDPLDGFAHARILYAGPDSTNSRVAGRLHLSDDEGTSWPVAKLLYPGKYGYSILTVLDDQSIGVLFERSRQEGFSLDVEHLSLARVSLEWLSDGRDCFSADPAGAVCLACNDGTDNDADGLVDYPADPECSGYAGAFEGDLPLTGWQLLLRDAQRWDRLRVSSRDRGIQAPEPAGPGDLRAAGARLRLVNPIGGETTEFSLPPEGWRLLGSRKQPRWLYRYPRGGAGACRFASLEPRRGFHARCASRDLGFSLDEPGGQGALDVVLELSGLPPQCMRFGGRVLRDVAAGSRRPGIFRAKRAPAPKRCGP